VISDEDREKVRQATDILALVSETVELRQRGASDFWGCCPFHHEKSPSFHVNTQTGLWKCFGCGAGGDVFDYVMKRENLDFPDAIRYLAERDGIELSEERGSFRKGPRRNRLLECLGEAESFYSTMLLRGRGAGPDAGRRYLGGRGFGSAVCRSWHLGFAPGRGTLVAHLRGKGFSTQEMLAADLAVMRDGRPADRFYDRVMFPIHDEQGRTIAFGGRVLTDAKPKYLNTKETSVFHKGKHLFAFDRAKESIAAMGTAIVSEGYTDVISLHEAGYTNAVAALGTSFSLDHVRTLSRFAKRIICMFDGDAAGQRAAERAIQFIDKTEADLRCVVLPDDQDPAEFLSTHQPQELQPILDAARPLMDFVFEKRLEGYDLASPGRRVAALQDMAKLLAPLKSSFVLDEYATQLADALGMDVAETKRVIRETPVPRRQGEEDARPAAPRAARGTRGQGAAAPAAYGGRGAAGPAPRGQAPRPAVPAAYQDPYQGFDDGSEYVSDYVPAEAEGDLAAGGTWRGGLGAAGGGAWGGGPSRPETAVALSADERRQVAAERELLGMMAAYPDQLRPYAERISTFSWTDERHESIAWAILATPEGTPPAEVVAAATAVVPDAPRILASGVLAGQEGMSFSDKVAFVLDTMELCSTRRKIRQIRARLRAQEGMNLGEDAKRLFLEATEMQRHANELSRRLSDVENR
jgi:DNA primase